MTRKEKTLYIYISYYRLYSKYNLYKILQYIQLCLKCWHLQTNRPFSGHESNNSSRCEAKGKAAEMVMR